MGPFLWGPPISRGHAKRGDGPREPLTGVNARHLRVHGSPFSVLDRQCLGAAAPLTTQKNPSPVQSSNQVDSVYYAD